ncbi:hypothetical protein J6TS2_09790 [Heyndrickxia sporothermodurans]|nr:hypothetical protein J6TS2_09790 [Heyndrickxia sporothermodurans]
MNIRLAEAKDIMQLTRMRDGILQSSMMKVKRTNHSMTLKRNANLF